MRKQTCFLGILSVVLGIVGYFLRRLHLIWGRDEAGFFRSGFVWRWLPALLLLVFAAGLLLLSRRLGRSLGIGTAVHGSRVDFGIMLLAGVLLIYTGVTGFRYPVGARLPRLYVIRAVLCLLSGVGLPCLALPDGRGSENALPCTAGAVLVLYEVFHLICTYLNYSYEPDTWVYVLQILVPCANMLTVFYFSGYFFGRPRPFFCLASASVTAMLALIAMADGADRIGLATSALAAVAILRMAGRAAPPAPETPAENRE